MIIRDPAAILPLMGTGGWGKSACESLRISDELFADIFMARLVEQNVPRPHPSSDRSTRRCRARKTTSNVEPRIQPDGYERIRTDSTQENLGIFRGDRPTRSSRPRRDVSLFHVSPLPRALEPHVDPFSIRFDIMADIG